MGQADLFKKLMLLLQQGFHKLEKEHPMESYLIENQGEFSVWKKNEHGKFEAIDIDDNVEALKIRNHISCDPIDLGRLLFAF